MASGLAVAGLLAAAKFAWSAVYNPVVWTIQRDTVGGANVVRVSGRTALDVTFLDYPNEWIHEPKPVAPSALPLDMKCGDTQRYSPIAKEGTYYLAWIEKGHRQFVNIPLFPSTENLEIRWREVTRGTPDAD